MQTGTIEILKDLLDKAVWDGRYRINDSSGDFDRDFLRLYNRISQAVHSLEYNEGLPEGTLDVPALTELKEHLDERAAERATYENEGD